MLAYRSIARRRVILTLLGGQMFTGILWAQRGPLLVLRNAESLADPTRPVSVDGELVVERTRVQYMQVLP